MCPVLFLLFFSRVDKSIWGFKMKAGVSKAQTVRCLLLREQVIDPYNLLHCANRRPTAETKEENRLFCARAEEKQNETKAETNPLQHETEGEQGRLCTGMAKIRVGDMYCNGENGTRVDKVEGRRWYVKALEEDGYSGEGETYLVNYIGTMAQARLDRLVQVYEKNQTKQTKQKKGRRKKNNNSRKRKSGAFSMEDDDSLQTWTNNLMKLYQAYDPGKARNRLFVLKEIEQHRHAERLLFKEKFIQYTVPYHKQPQYVRLKFDPLSSLDTRQAMQQQQLNDNMVALRQEFKKCAVALRKKGKRMVDTAHKGRVATVEQSIVDLKRLLREIQQKMVGVGTTKRELGGVGAVGTVGNGGGLVGGLVGGPVGSPMGLTGTAGGADDSTEEEDRRRYEQVLQKQISPFKFAVTGATKTDFSRVVAPADGNRTTRKVNLTKLIHNTATLRQQLKDNEANDNSVR